MLRDAREPASATALRSEAGLPPQPIRWVLVRDPSGTHDAQAVQCTDADLAAEAILTRFAIRRPIVSGTPSKAGWIFDG